MRRPSCIHEAFDSHGRHGFIQEGNEERGDGDGELEGFRGISLDDEGTIREAKGRARMGQGGRRDRKWSEGNRAGEGGVAWGREGRPWIRLSSIILSDNLNLTLHTICSVNAPTLTTSNTKRNAFTGHIPL